VLHRRSDQTVTPDAWQTLSTLASRALRSILVAPHVVRRSSLAPVEVRYLAQALEDLTEERILSPLLRFGEDGWQRLAAEVSDPRRSWRDIRNRWIVRGYPEAWQAQMWQRYVPCLSSARQPLIEAMNTRQARGTAPRSFERRLVFRLARGAEGWTIVGSEFEDAEPGDESPFRIVVIRTHGKPP